MWNKLLILIMTLLMLCGSALGEVDLYDQPRLVNKTLLAPIKKTEYASWTLYQPRDRETDINVTKDRGFKERAFFPVLAVKDDHAALILLHRVKGKWKVEGVNTKALDRPGFTLRLFTLDTSFSGNDGTPMQVGFSYELSDGTNAELCFEPSEDYGSRFRSISIVTASPQPEHLFAKYVSVIFNSGLTYTYCHDGSNLIKYNLDGPDAIAEYRNFDTFDLTQVPLTILDAMLPARVTRETALRQLPHPDAFPLLALTPGEEVLSCASRYVSASFDRLVYAHGAMGYVSPDALEFLTQ